VSRDVTVIADDLSGAADCGAAFAAAGLATFVALGGSGGGCAAQVVSIDTDSRPLPAEQAARRTNEAARRAYALGTRALYKKIDSTLRGNVGAELLAAHEAGREVSPDPAPLLVVSPAFPSAARIVRAGRVLVRGVPLGETQVWRQSGRQGTSALDEMLRDVGLVVESASTEALRSEGRWLQRIADGAAQAVVCDAEDDSDLRTIAEAGARLDRAVIWAGSAGLARHLPAALNLERRASHRPAASWASQLPMLLLVGSRSEVSREQARRVATETEVTGLAVPAGLLLTGEPKAAWTQTTSHVARALLAGSDVLLTIEGEPSSAEPDTLAAEGLGRLCAALPPFGGLVATGGDTARAALAALGASGLHLLGEVEPGVPIGLTDHPRPMLVVTKAGAFGTPHTLQRCRAALRERRE